MRDNTPAASAQNTPRVDAPTRSLKKAYALLLIGFLGAHRFYLGKWLTGTLYLCVTFLWLVFVVEEPEAAEVLAWLMLILLVIDSIFLSKQVGRRNKNLADEFESHPERFIIAEDDHIAPWARGREKKSSSGFLANTIRTYSFFLVLPAVTGGAAAQLHSLELLIIPIVILVAIGLLGSLDQTLNRFPTILEIPGVGPALERISALRAHYWEHEPKIGRAFFGLFRQAGSEYKPYWSLASIVMATVIIEGVITIPDNTYIEWYTVVGIVAITAVFAAVVTLINLVPLTALTFHYALSGKRTRIGFMTVAALIATVAGYTGSTLQENQSGGGNLPSYLSELRLEERMKNPDFRWELVKKMDVFLNYYISAGFDDATMRTELGNLLKSLAPNDESDAFGIIDSDRWAGVLYHHDEALCGTQGFNNYSLLAVVYKPSVEERIVALNKLDADENVDVFELIKRMNEKNIAYSKSQIPLELYDHILSEDCRTLICDKYDSCSQLNAASPEPGNS